MNFHCTCSSSVKTLLAHLSLTTHPQEIKPKLCLYLTKNICTEWLHIRQKAAGQKSPSQAQEHQRKAKHILSCPSALLEKKKGTFTAAQESILDPWSAKGTTWSPLKNPDNGHLRHWKFWITGSTKEHRKEVSDIWTQSYYTDHPK